MTVSTNAFGTYQAIGNREDLSNVITKISPTKTPFMMLAGKGKADARTHEWQTDALAAAVTTNAQLEGDVVVPSASTPTVRLLNYCQISRKDATVTGTQEKVDKAGRRSEMAYQMSKRLPELKRDMESVLCSNQRGAAGATGTARKLRGLAAFNNTNTNRYTASTSGTKGKNSTAPNSATGAGTDAGNTRALTELLLKAVLATGYTAGADFKYLMVGPHNKQTVSTFAGRSSSREMVDKNKILGAADIYMSDYGDIKVLPNIFGRERDAVLLDPKMVSVDYLRPAFTKDLPVFGDAVSKAVIVEYTLRVNNYGGIGMIADINTSS
jgi:hypothetical protein